MDIIETTEVNGVVQQHKAKHIVVLAGCAADTPAQQKLLKCMGHTGCLPWRMQKSQCPVRVSKARWNTLCWWHVYYWVQSEDSKRKDLVLSNTSVHPCLPTSSFCWKVCLAGNAMLVHLRLSYQVKTCCSALHNLHCRILWPESPSAICRSLRWVA